VYFYLSQNQFEYRTVRAGLFPVPSSGGGGGGGGERGFRGANPFVRAGSHGLEPPSGLFFFV